VSRRVLAVAVAAALMAALQLASPWVEPRAGVGSAGVGTGSHPVVLVSGLGSDGSGFASLIRALEDAGTPVLDFDATTTGVQPLVYPRSGLPTSIPALATDLVAPEIAAALARAGYPADQEVDVVAHSTGGLAMRYLVEQQGWAARVDDLVMVAVPNHGSTVVWLETRGGGPFDGLGTDMRPGSAFLDSLGYAEPPGEVYTTIGGDPALFRWVPIAGLGSGFDDQVPTGSPALTGAANSVYPCIHGRLLDNTAVVRLIVDTLRAGSAS
jgi:hypothetical protein